MDELKCTALALNEDETAHALIYSRMGRGAALLGGDAYPMQKNINAADWAARDTLQLVLGDETAEVFGQKDGSFPAALDALLYARWQAKKPGLIVLSCAAAEHNAQHLLEAAIACAVARHAQPGYLRYLVSDNAFCATLSDCAEWLIEADEKPAAAQERRGALRARSFSLRAAPHAHAGRGRGDGRRVRLLGRGGNAGRGVQG